MLLGQKDIPQLYILYSTIKTHLKLGISIIYILNVRFSIVIKNRGSRVLSEQ
jgi:hypothetical protein